MILANPHPGNIVMLSDLTDPLASSDVPFTIELCYEDEPFFTARNTTSPSGIYACRDIVGEYMRGAGLSLMELAIKARADDGTAAGYNVYVVYSDVRLDRVDTAMFLQRHFLTPSTVRLVNPGDSCTFAYITLAGESTTRTAVVQYELNGELKTTRLTSQPWTDSATQYYEEEVILSDYASELPAGARLMAVHVAVGLRSASLYVARSPLSLRFCFRNSFGVADEVVVDAKITEKRKAQRSITLLSARASAYDISTEQSYEVEMSAMPLRTAALVAEMVGSRDVRMVVGKTEVPILVTAGEPEVERGTDGLASAKITFRIADNLPSLVGVDIARIFTDPYNYNYA